MLKYVIIACAALLLTSCSQDQPKQQTVNPATAQTSKQVASTKESTHMLVFFINPDGAPCQMQDKILSQMADELDGKVIVRPVQTTVKTDLDIFYAYGIRALPTLLLADAQGQEIKRLSPGVHPAETIRDLINLIPAQ